MDSSGANDAEVDVECGGSTSVDSVEARHSRRQCWPIPMFTTVNKLRIAFLMGILLKLSWSVFIHVHEAVLYDTFTDYVLSTAIPHLRLVAVLALSPTVVWCRGKLWHVLCQCWAMVRCYEEGEMERQGQSNERGSRDGWRKSLTKHVVLFAVVSLIILIINEIYPIILLNSLVKDGYDPVPISRVTDSALFERIQALASPLGFNTSSIYAVRYLHNALYVGLPTSPLILIDRAYLPGQPGRKSMKDGEVLAVLAHELGHWWHLSGIIGVAERISYAAVVIAVTFALRDFDALYTMFGYRPHKQDGPWLTTRCLIVAFYVLMPLNELYTPLSNLFQRYKENQADAFAAQLGYGIELCSGLLKMQGGQMYEMDPLYYAYFADHPSLQERRVRIGC